MYNKVWIMCRIKVPFVLNLGLVNRCLRVMMKMLLVLRRDHSLATPLSR